MRRGLLLRIAPITLRDAHAFVQAHHRHLGASVGGKLAIAVRDGAGRLRGVAVVGRPIARFLDDGRTLEVTRVATDGVRNGCSMLYGAARRAARLLGYRRIVTYTLAHEQGASLRASGFAAVATTRAASWSRASRQRPEQILLAKTRWECSLISHV
jgi:hypothetical protein